MKLGFGKVLLSAAMCLGTACSEDSSDGGAGAAAAASGGSGGMATGGTSGASSGGAGGATGGVGGVAGVSSGGTSGAMSTGGVSGAASGGSGGASGTMSTGGASGGEPDGGTEDSGTADLEPFSFFVTSYEAMVRLSGSDDGFGGDLRYMDAPDGLTGADRICTEIAEYSMPGASAKGWRAFLSVADDGNGQRVDAIDRIGEGPWFDRLGRTVAETTEDLQNERPDGADGLIANDLPNEYGIQNHRPDPTGPEIDNHHVLTGSDGEGRLYQGNVNGTCDNWTALEDAGRPRIGFSWSIQNRIHWISGQDEGGCGAGVDLDGGGGSDPSNPVVGSGGGYGAIYCFALMQ